MTRQYLERCGNLRHPISCKCRGQNAPLCPLLGSMHTTHTCAASFRDAWDVSGDTYGAIAMASHRLELKLTLPLPRRRTVWGTLALPMDCNSFPCTGVAQAHNHAMLRAHVNSAPHMLAKHSPNQDVLISNPQHPIPQRRCG